MSFPPCKLGVVLDAITDVVNVAVHVEQRGKQKDCPYVVVDALPASFSQTLVAIPPIVATTGKNGKQSVAAYTTSLLGHNM
ncbi:hypothetical protein V6N13_126930 [Hibiscus sabdariffa]|uniref:Uncharacterized protein n=2 Tax=Hibiscus sabdariffa TaxID=183260 RepID=A0ABR2REJ5_9ROSI